MNVGQVLSRAAKRYPKQTAVFDSERELSYQELERRSNRFGNLAREKFGLDRGDRVALFAGNRIEVAEVMTGAAKAGLTYVGLNFRLSHKELVEVFGNAEPALIVVESRSRELIESANATMETPAEIVDLDAEDSAGYEALLADADDRLPPAIHEVWPDDDFCLVYTSGTTGTPKGVWFDHRRVLQHATAAALEYEINSRSRYLMSIPHNSSVNITLVPGLMRGAALGLHESRSFDALAFAKAIEDCAATHSFLVPTQLYRLLDQVPSNSRQLDSLETMGYGAAPMSPERLGELLERYGPIFIQLYGMAEIASIGTMLRKSDHRAALEDGRTDLLSTVGQPSYLTDVRVVDEARVDVAPGERGEVIFGSPHAMKGYFRDPERTAKTLIGGWVHSGDIGQFDDEGYLRIVDRKKDLIIIGGHNIAPAEIESAIHRNPAVLEAGVIGIPDPEWGEAVLAVVSLRSDAEVAPEELLHWCREHSNLPTVKQPARFEILDALPKNAIGKIAKDELRRQFREADS